MQSLSIIVTLILIIYLIRSPSYCSALKWQQPASGLWNPYPRFAKFDDGGHPGEPLFLTPLLRNHSIPREQIREMAKVADITQYHKEKSYSGLLTVNDKYNSNMFFWYFPAREDPTYAPVVLWLQGGPGASSLFGLFAENGPFALDSHGNVFLRNHSWSQTHNMIYIDNPVGTGYSFTDDDAGYAKKESDVAENLHEALQQLYELFQWTPSAGFWIAGESYAGKYIPALAYQIDKADNARIQIPLKGMAIGNGFCDPIHQLNYGDYLYQLGLIDEHALLKFVELEKKATVCISKNDMDCALDVFGSLVFANNSLFQNVTGFNYFYNYLQPQHIAANVIGNFVQSSAVRHSIHVGDLTFHDTDGTNKVQSLLKQDFMASVAHLLEDLLDTYTVCIYSGQLDVIVAYPMTVNFLQHLKFRDSGLYKVATRNIWMVDDDVAGYIKYGGNLMEVLVRNAGHMAPADQPKHIYELINQLTHGH